MQHLRGLDVAVIAIYMAAVVWIGLRLGGRQTTTERYFMAKRSVPSWAVGFSLFATMITSVSFIAYPGSAYAGQWTELLQGLMGVAVLAIVAAVLVPFFRHVIGMSAYEYFEQRFSYGVRAYGSIIFAIGHFTKMGFIFYLVSLAIQSLTGWSLYGIIGATGLVTVIYTCVGGMEAVIWIDVVQGFVLWAGLLVSLAYLLFLPPGGPAAPLHLAWAAHKISFGSLAFNLSHKNAWVMAAYGFFYYLQRYSADQTLVQRYLVAKTDRGAVKAVGLAVALCLPVWILFLLIGSLTWSYYRLSGEVLPAAITKPDQVFPYFLSVHIPVGLAGVIMASLFASAMSGVSADLNCLAALGVGDFYSKLRPAASDARKLRWGKVLVVLSGALCVLIACALAGTTRAALPLYFVLSSIVAGGLFGVFFLAFISPRANAPGIWCGIGASLLFTLYAALTGGDDRLVNLGRGNFPWHSLMVGPLSNLVVIAVGAAASRLFPRAPRGRRELTLKGWLERRRCAPAPASPALV